MKHRALPVLLALFSLNALPFAVGAETPPSPDRIQPIAGYVIGGLERDAKAAAESSDEEQGRAAAATMAK